MSIAGCVFGRWMLPLRRTEQRKIVLVPGCAVLIDSPELQGVSVVQGDLWVKIAPSNSR